MKRIISHLQRNRTAILLCALLASLVLAATWKLAFAQRAIARGDLLLYFYPLRDFASQAIREGRLPLWNPFTFMGAPFLANSQVGFFYPFNIITAFMSVTDAVSLNITLHLLIAALGTYALSRHSMRLSPVAAFVSATVFALGGYLGAQVEHFNQLQVLAWLPLQVMLLLSTGRWLRRLSVLALIIALQITAGHTQSLYICMMTLGLVVTVHGIAWWLLARRNTVCDSQPRIRGMLLGIIILFGAVVIAGAISAAQLLPTIELASLSARSGGLPFNEVASFSWRPWVMARSLLPAYGDPLFAEYVTYLGVTGLALLALGGLLCIRAMWPVRNLIALPAEEIEQRAHVVTALVIMLLGAVLALGLATPLFGLLYHYLPGFNLFRAQARWLIMFSLGSALLIGMATQALTQGLPIQLKRYWLLGWVGVSVIVVSGLFLGARFSPEAEYRALPTPPVLVAWLAGWIAVTGCIIYHLKRNTAGMRTGIPLVVLLVVELLVAAQFQPAARASDKQAVTDLRPSTASLLADYSHTSVADGGSERILALSGLFFDPGDMPEQRLIYQSQLNSDELYDRIIASKHEEILSPNLSLLYRLPGVDGYDGGLLPLRAYADFTSQFTAPSDSAEAKHTSDGRLREVLPAIPDNEWLRRMAVKYIITDKTQDVFIDNVYYDLQVTQGISTALSLPLDAFESTALGIVYRASSASQTAFTATLSFAAGEPLIFSIPSQLTQTSFLMNWSPARTPQAVTISVADSIMIQGMTSIDGRSGAFLSQPVRGDRNLRVVHSGDVKIYENLNSAPRIQVVSASNCSTSNGELVIDTPPTQQDKDTGYHIQVLEDSPEQLVMTVSTDLPGWLVVRDSNYPGWTATLDGRNAPIIPADSLFRATEILPGNHTVTFSYQPASARAGLTLSIVGIAMWIALSLLACLYHGKAAAPAKVRAERPHDWQS